MSDEKGKTLKSQFSGLTPFSLELASLPQVVFLLAHLLPLFPLMTNQQSHALTSPVRQRMLRIVGKHPGISISELKEKFSFQWASFYHHLGELEEVGVIRAGRDPTDRRRKLLYATRRGRPTEQGTPKLSMAARKIATIILKNPGIERREVVERSNYSARSTYYHLQRLEAHKFITIGPRNKGSRVKPRASLRHLLA